MMSNRMAMFLSILGIMAVIVGTFGAITGLSDGYFVAGMGCLLIASVGIALRRKK